MDEQLTPLPEYAEGYGVVLRRWRAADVELLHQTVAESIDHLRPWMDWTIQEPLTLEKRREMLERWERRWARGGDVTLAIMVDDRLAGSTGLHRRRGPTALEIGYWVHPAFLRQRVATRAARLLTDIAFTIPGIEGVEIHHDKANRASAGVPRRLGYTFMGEKRDERSAPAELGIDCTWRITRAAWATIDHLGPRSSAG
jgi:ribosomal-protein-serine acetyltransferase